MSAAAPGGLALYASHPTQSRCRRFPEPEDLGVARGNGGAAPDWGAFFGVSVLAFRLW